MNKRSRLIGFFSLLLVMLLLPTSAVAGDGVGDFRSPLASALGRLLELMTDLLAGDLGHGVDPWGGAVPPDDTTNDGDVGPGWDPWGGPAQIEDIGVGLDPWG